MITGVSWALSCALGALHAFTHCRSRRGSGYDRGHLVPAADTRASPDAMRETFYLVRTLTQTRCRTAWLLNTHCVGALRLRRRTSLLKWVMGSIGTTGRGSRSSAVSWPSLGRRKR